MTKNKRSNLINTTKFTLSLAAMFTPIFLNSKTTNATIGNHLGAVIRISGGGSGNFTSYMKKFAGLSSNNRVHYNPINKRSVTTQSHHSKGESLLTLANRPINTHTNNNQDNASGSQGTRTLSNTPPHLTGNVSNLTKKFEDIIINGTGNKNPSLEGLRKTLENHRKDIETQNNTSIYTQSYNPEKTTYNPSLLENNLNFLNKMNNIVITNNNKLDEILSMMN